MSWGFPDGSIGKESIYNARDPVSILESGRSAGEGIGYLLQYSWASLVAQLVRICLQCGRPGFNPWVGKIPWRRKGYPLLYSDLENSMDCMVHGVAKSQTRLSNFHFHYHNTEQSSLCYTIVLYTALSLFTTLCIRFPGLIYSTNSLQICTLKQQLSYPPPTVPW